MWSYLILLFFRHNFNEIIRKKNKKYPLLTIKKSTFTLFKDIIELLINKEHLDSNGLLKIMCIRIKMNRGITEEGLERIKLIKSRMNSKRI
jgi:hypothetical protein